MDRAATQGLQASVLLHPVLPDALVPLAFGLLLLGPLQELRPLRLVAPVAVSARVFSGATPPPGRTQRVTIPPLSWVTTRGPMRLL